MAVSKLCKLAAPSLNQGYEMDWTNCSEQGLHKTSWRNGSMDIGRCRKGTPKMWCSSWSCVGLDSHSGSWRLKMSPVQMEVVIRENLRNERGLIVLF